MEESKSESRKEEKKTILDEQNKKSISDIKHNNLDGDTNMSNFTHSGSSIRSITLNEGLEQTRGNGRSHLMYGTLLAFNACFAGFANYTIPFLSKYPAFLCQYHINEDWKECSLSEVCHPTEFENIRYEIDYTSSETIDNWITSMNLQCKPDYMIGMFGSLLFLGIT